MHSKNEIFINRIDRNLSVGRPRVYFAVDVYSRIITGIHIGFEEDSWEGYSKLLYNTFFDKQIYCNYFDIKISKEDWNVCGLPKIILGDRGGFINKKSDVLYNYFNISVELAPSYIASSKGAVEKKFDIIEKMIKDELPGVIMTKFRERGKRDYRKDAKLDIYEFTQIIIETVLERNAKIMMNYPSQKELALANVKPCANDIWNYAMKNTGNLTNIQEDKLRYHLLQHEKAKKTHKGIEYRKFIYKIEDAKIETAISRLHKSKGVEIIYDESNLNVIYMCDNDSKKLIKCILNDKFTSNDIYYDRTMQEIINYDINMTIKNQSTFRDINDQLFHDQEQNRKEIINNAINKSQGNKIDVNEIEFNRNTEKESYNEYQRNMIDELNSNNIDGNSDDFEVRNHSESTTKLKRSRDILSDFIQNKISDK